MQHQAALLLGRPGLENRILALVLTRRGGSFLKERQEDMRTSLEPGSMN
jgi:hypothetical protein